MAKKSLFEQIEDAVVPSIGKNPLYGRRYVPADFARTHRRLSKNNIFLRILVVVAGVCSFLIFILVIVVLAILAVTGFFG